MLGFLAGGSTYFLLAQTTRPVAFGLMGPRAGRFSMNIIKKPPKPYQNQIIGHAQQTRHLPHIKSTSPRPPRCGEPVQVTKALLCDRPRTRAFLRSLTAHTRVQLGAPHVLKLAVYPLIHVVGMPLDSHFAQHSLRRGAARVPPWVKKPRARIWHAPPRARRRAMPPPVSHFGRRSAPGRPLGVRA